MFMVGILDFRPTKSCELCCQNTLSPSLSKKYLDLELAPGRPDFIRTGCRGITGPVPPPLLMEVTQTR